MSSSTSGDNSRMQVISQAFKSGSWAGCGLIVPWMRIPSWALIVCVLFAVACGTLRAIVPQESADRLVWWTSVLHRNSSPPDTGAAERQTTEADALPGPSMGLHRSARQARVAQVVVVIRKAGSGHGQQLGRRGVCGSARE